MARWDAILMTGSPGGGKNVAAGVVAFVVWVLYAAREAELDALEFRFRRIIYGPGKVRTPKLPPDGV